MEEKLRERIAFLECLVVELEHELESACAENDALHQVQSAYLMTRESEMVN